MPKIVRTLTDPQVRKITDEGTHAVAPGLYLRVRGQSRTFVTRHVDPRTRKRVWVKVGDARVMRVSDASRVPQRVSGGAGLAVGKANFADAAERYLCAHAGGWNDVHRRQWRQTLDDYILPELGQMDVPSILPADVVRVLYPLWTSKNETARRVRGRIENVIDFANAEAGLVVLNPADRKLVSRLLPKVAPSDRHHEAPTVEQLRDFISGLSDAVSCRCFILTALTAVRTTEARMAQWSEIDGNVWTVPASRMKAGKPHRVPLSPEALVTLGKRPRRGGSVFGDLSLNAMRQLLIDRDVSWTVHGVRSTFRDWSARDGYSDTLAEIALAHTVGTKTVRAYARDDLLEQRRPMMEAWAKILLSFGKT